MKYRSWSLDSFEIQTLLSPKEVLDVVKANTEPRQFFRPWSETKYFEGEVDDANFKVRRIIKYRNSFLPQINGAVDAVEMGSIVSVKMRLHGFVEVFSSIWTAGFLAAVVGFGSQSSLGQSASRWAAIESLGILAFGIVLTSVGFWYEANLQEKKLILLLKRWKCHSVGHGRTEIQFQALIQASNDAIFVPEIGEKPCERQLPWTTILLPSRKSIRALRKNQRLFMKLWSRLWRVKAPADLLRWVELILAQQLHQGVD
jgi:hypothetical protein